jgi:5-methylcytosine-specific restriction endonuclease McrA
MGHNVSDDLFAVSKMLAAGNHALARSTASERLPFTPRRRHKHNISDRDKLRVYLRDGFIDCYTGRRVWHPCALRLFAEFMPDLLPYHKNGRLDQCHILHWHLSPAVDHIVPVTRGGDHAPQNWITTSWGKNTLKSNMSLDELGWSIYPQGNLNHWDGGTGWYLAAMENETNFRDRAPYRKWYRDTLATLLEFELEATSLMSYCDWAPRCSASH